ncbi:aminotransferase class IV [Herbiconiux moechotypicola]|uniref:Aminodeoxychorismate lyase n=1 Tax=Herbiconiux moechotypicola TaxID=637393 RepID=A0ABP5QMM8_9MICO|nr:aminotransferase class IV [Herbiconiux moechotypicola]MCS5730383.1 aminotransferase class IV [Herbiconiux moechotypicola]
MAAPVLILVDRPLLGMSGGRRNGDGSSPGFAAADPSAPQLSVFDLGVTRADGVFETVMVSDRNAPALEAHLARLSRSAAALDFPPLDLGVWRDAVAAAVAAHPRVGLLAVKLVLTRGVEGTERPTAWVTAREAPDFTELRRRGLRVITLDRGVPHDLGSRSPWLPAAAKTLSYEVNSAALREAARRGADDAVFVSSDGYVLEATTSSVLLRHGDRFTTPDAGQGGGSSQGIVAGTTVRRAFEVLERLGHTTASEALPVAALTEADGIWLLSSIRRAVPVTRLDRAEREVDHDLTAKLNDELGR